MHALTDIDVLEGPVWTRGHSMEFKHCKNNSCNLRVLVCWRNKLNVDKYPIQPGFKKPNLSL